MTTTRRRSVDLLAAAARRGPRRRAGVRGLPARDQPRNLARLPVARRPAHPARRRHARRHRRATVLPRRPQAREGRRQRPHARSPTAQTNLVVKYDGQTVQRPRDVKDATTDRPISFKLDVMPVFMRAGCNTGSCHGAARGKDGFRLSLFGYDPDGDYHRLTREIATRRINLALPDESLMLHEGDRRRPAHRRHAVRRPARVLQDAAPLARSRRAERPARRRRRRSSLEILPEAGRARRRGHDAADDRAGEVLRRHRPRRDQPRAVPQQQRQRPPRSTRTASSPPANRGEAFVMARFATFTVGSQVDRHARRA